MLNMLVIMLFPVLNLFGGGAKVLCKSRQASSSFQSVRLTHFPYPLLI